MKLPPDMVERGNALMRKLAETEELFKKVEASRDALIAHHDKVEREHDALERKIKFDRIKTNRENVARIRQQIVAEGNGHTLIPEDHELYTSA